jgi:cytochrome oxidase Cu insertion factor (SCO1/SenC/PrrC family)
VRRRDFIGLAAMGMVGGIRGFSWAAAPLTGKPAPDFTVMLMDGRVVALKDLRGKPVLVNFWSSG